MKPSRLKKNIETPNVCITDCTVTCVAGENEGLLQGLHALPQSVMTLDSTILSDRAGYFGKIREKNIPREKDIGRTNGLLCYLADQMADTIKRLRSDYQSHRILIIIATTTTGMKEIEAQPFEQIDYHRQQELAAVSENLMRYCKLQCPNLVVSTACTSGAKVLGLARMFIRLGLCDAALAGGSETLNRLTCRGFESIESYAENYCRPFQPDRDGINIGEGAALFVLERADSGIALSGFAESSDAWHESAPEPEGIGPESAIRSALLDARITPENVDYINLHGTGTRLNDAMEAKVIHRIFGTNTPASSTKSVTGHTLGLAGSLEAAILWLLVKHPTAVELPPHHGAENYDPDLPKINVVRTTDNPPCSVNTALSTSFAFGGHNTALVLTRINA